MAHTFALVKMKRKCEREWDWPLQMPGSGMEQININVIVRME